MAKKPDPPSSTDEQRQPIPRAARRKGQNADLVPSAEASTTEAMVPGAGQRAEPRNHRELAEAIFAECDPVKIGRELLESGNDKGASVRARVFETLADWQFGQKPASSAPARPRVRFIWTIPGPPRESEVPPEPEPPENE